MRRIVVVAFAIFLILFSSHVWASFPSVFGIGGESMSKGNTSTSIGSEDPHLAFTNPAQLGFFKNAKISAGILMMDVDMRSFGRVVIDESGNFGIFDTSGVLGGRGQTVALSAPIGSKKHPLVFGFAAYLSGESISRVSGPPVNNPFYPMYQDVSRNAAYTASVGYRVYRGLSLGFAGNTSLLSLANYKLVNTSSASYSSSTVEVKSIFSPTFAALYDFSTCYSDSCEELGKTRLPWTIGIIRRGKSELKTKLNATINAQGIPISGELFSYPHFSPAEWVLTSSFAIPRNWLFSLDLSYVQWSDYKNPFGSGNINSLIFGSGSEKAGFKDVLVPKVGAQYTLEPVHSFAKEWNFRAGYFYYKSPVPNQTGNSNFADSNRHGITAGIGLGVKNPWKASVEGGKPSLIRFDSFAQLNHLEERKVTKARTNDLGGPGYTVGGNIWIYGLSIALDL